jgi:hypothetical protein
MDFKLGTIAEFVRVSVQPSIQDEILHFLGMEAQYQARPMVT